MSTDEFYETDEPVDYVVAAFDRGTVGQTVSLDLGVQSYRDAAAEAETLRQELAALREVEAKLGVAEAELARSEAACASAMAEIEALKQDRAWERDRANEAARLSAEARDCADDLRRQIEALNEQVSIVEGDRTDNDRWAVNLVVKFALDPPAKLDPYDAIARGLREWRQFVLDAEAKLEAMVRIRAEARAASAERDDLSKRLTVACEQRDMDGA